MPGFVAASRREGLKRHCSFLPCPVSVYGRVGDIEVERITNLFSPNGEVLAKTGLVAESLLFHEARP
jgi:hypothetical protein